MSGRHLRAPVLATPLDDPSDRVGTADPLGPPAPAPARVLLSVLALASLALLVLCAATGWRPGLLAGAALFLVVGTGAAPALSLRLPGTSGLLLTATALGTSCTVLVGLAMARSGEWHPVAALVVVAAVAVPWLVSHLRRDLDALLAAPPARPRRASLLSAAAIALGLALVAGAAATHRGLPTPGGLLSVVGPWWYLGAVVLLLAALEATARRRATLGPAVLALAVAVVGSQALVYGAPTVLSAARHVGVVEFVRAYGSLRPEDDIYHAWAGLFAAAAWICDLGAVADPLSTVATASPVALTAGTALAVRVLAGRLGLSPQRAWWAAAVFSLAGTLNTTYFSPQAVGILLALALAGLALTAPRSLTRAAPGTVAAVVVVGCALAVAHQISPYLLTLALGVLLVFGVLRPWWPVAAAIVPALAWAAVNASQVTSYVSIGAFGDIFSNIRPPSQVFLGLPQPLVTQLTFAVPAGVLVLVGLAALAAWWQHRDRRAWALLVSAASTVGLAVGSDYGQEAIFRIALFALPWLAVAALTLRLPRRRGLAALAGGSVLLLSAHAFGATGMDWARVVRPDAAEQAARLERESPEGSTVFALGTGNGFPAKLTERYFESVPAIVDFWGEGATITSAPGTQALAEREVAAWTASVRPGCTAECYVVVADSVTAYNARYGIQTVEDQARLAAAIASSPAWQVHLTGPTATTYRLAPAAAPGSA